MLKKGFSLAEVLITLTIVGIVSVIVAPYVSNLMPNKDKIEFLRAYNLINQATQDLLSNESIYYTTYNQPDETATDKRPQRYCEGLNCTDPAYNSAIGLNYIEANPAGWHSDEARTKHARMEIQTSTPGTPVYFEKRYKYPNLMIKTLSIDEEPRYMIANEGQSITNIEDYKFNITKNIQCWIDSRGTAGSYSYLITIKLLNGSGNDCAYNSSSCTNPDKFKLNVDKWGNITGEDSLSKVYLKNPNNTNNKKQDLYNAQLLGNN